LPHRCHRRLHGRDDAFPHAHRLHAVS
jgi:hypothetical protein